MAKKANACCGWCCKPVHYAGKYDRRKQTVYCSPEHMIVDYLFRTLYADEQVFNKFDITEWKKGKDDE